MNKLLTILLCSFLLSGFALADSAYYKSKTESCGCHSYFKRVFHGYDNCRRPIYRYYRTPVKHNHSCTNRPRYTHHQRYSYSHSSASRHYPHYYNSRSYNHHRNSRVNIYYNRINPFCK